MRLNWIQGQIDGLLEVSGLDLANLKILICALLSFPFSGIFKRLPDHNYTLRNVYIVLVSSFYIFGILELYRGLATLLFSSLGCYFITRYLRTDNMPWVNFVFLMTHLCYHHLNEQFFQVYDPTVIDISGALMVMVMKLSAFGWNVHDARMPKETLTAYTRTRVIKKHPNLLPFLGYCFFYASLLTGPAFDYADYDRFIHNTLFEDVPESRRPGKRKRRIPRSGIPALTRTLQGFFWAFLFVQIPKYISMDHMFDESFVKSHNILYRINYMWALSFMHRLKYYAIWTIAEGSCILCGIGYNGYDSVANKFRWDRVQNIDTITFELGQNVHTCLEAWNMNTNKWLKNYVYLRLAKKGRKPGFKSTVATFATSAFWHGTRPGYYMTFILGALLQTLGKIYRKNLRPIFIDKDGNKSKYKPIYDVICYVCNQSSFGFLTQPFVILDFKKSVYCWSTVNFYLLIVCGVTFGFFRGPWSKQVIAFFNKYHMSHDKPEPVPGHLNRMESEKVIKVLNSYISKDRDLVDSPSLGVPALDDLENLNGTDIDEEIQELAEAWKSFQKRNNKTDELRDAYNNFVREINGIFATNKQDIVEKVKATKEDIKATADQKATDPKSTKRD